MEKSTYALSPEPTFFSQLRDTYQQIKPARFSSWLVTLLASVYLLLIFNSGFFHTVEQLHGLPGFRGISFMVSMFLFLLVLFNLLLTLFAVPYVLKPVVMVILLSAAFASYFMQTYNIMIDKSMIQNMMETDFHESQELLSGDLFLHVLLTGVLPIALLWKMPIAYGSWFRQLVVKTWVLICTTLVIGIIASLFYQDYASLFRNHRYIRNLIVPVNYIYSLQTYAKQLLPKSEIEFKTLGADAQLGAAWEQNPQQRKVVTILVVGETARYGNFSINGYDRETSPHLANEDIISFTNFYSCGTSTAVSVPCMFSIKDRSDFDSSNERYSENLLDTLKHAGFRVIWRDNNSGCKDVCTRVEYESVSDQPDPHLCRVGECFDMALLDQLEQEIDSSNKNTLIVLHQKGSHGPAYFLRVPREFQKFEPQCHTNQLQECSQKEITNAYDNTILYTDYFLSQVIGFLKSHRDKYDASMIYLSDHGESLGENNIYLHGLPYMLAPDEQIHVPFLFWMTDGFAERFAVSKECITESRTQPYSQDNLFDSVLGLLDVQTTDYKEMRDMFHHCRATLKDAGPLVAEKTS